MTIRVEVAYALPDMQRIIALDVEEPCSALQAARLSEIDKIFPEIDFESAKIGVFGKALAKPDAHILQAGERVEIYRPLLIDPKESRKKRAAKAKAAKAGQEEE